MKDKKPRIHFIGIGGIGMSFLARYFKSQNWAVSGSDLAKSDLTRTLTKEGVKVKIGHKNGVLNPKTALVVTSQAVQKGNLEVARARRLGVPVLPFPEVVGGLTREYTTVAVAGAHGKSTTTALIGLIMTKAGLDPTVMVGTKLKEFPRENFRAGKSRYLVLEADEYGRAFLNYSPTVAVITTIDREHLDTYKNLADIKKTFLVFLSNTKASGALVLNADDKNIFSLKKKIEVLAKTRHLKVFWYQFKNPDAKKIARIIQVPGQHNVSNALAALAAVRTVGVKDAVALRAIAAFHGTWRRMEYQGNFRLSGLPCRVYDDYAHHPTEIKATLKAFREKYPRSSLVCVFQPHQAKRLAFLFGGFSSAFANANVVILIPMYKVPGRDRAEQKYDSRKLTEAVQRKYPKKGVFYLANPKRIRSFLAKAVRHSPWTAGRDHFVVVMMGAGDIFQYTRNLVQ